MKKILLLTIVFCSGLLSSGAQEIGTVYWGGKLGYNYTLSKYSTNKKLPTHAVHGGYGGVMMKIPFDNRLFFVPQIDASYRGMSTDSLEPNQFSSVKEFHIRVMPLLQFEFKHPNQKSNTLFLQFGPSIGFGINGKQVKQDANNNKINADLKYGYQAYGRYDANWHMGLGYETEAGFRLLLEYAHGLGNMINTEMGPDLRYRTFSIGVGYWFHR